MQITYLIAALLLLLASGCGFLQRNPKYEFTDGYYRMKYNGAKSEGVYVTSGDGVYRVYRVAGRPKHQRIIDTARYTRIDFPELSESKATAVFRNPSRDLDFLTIPLKFRPQLSGFPRQLNTNLNGGVYFGFRNDVYRLQYVLSPLGSNKRLNTHFGFSFGGFAGLGATAINPSVTNGQVAIEYDGIVFTKGVAGIIGVNNVTVGLALGFDNLLDNNRRVWLYQHKPWVGLAFGLNLN